MRRKLELEELERQRLKREEAERLRKEEEERLRLIRYSGHLNFVKLFATLMCELHYV